VNEVTEKYNIPLEAVLGGPETMYPEYRNKLKDKDTRAGLKSRTWPQTA
jgi:hypothetical protein